MKKSLFFIALLLTGISVKAQYGYISQASGFTSVSSGIRNVSAVDSSVAWIAPYDGSGGGANRTDFSHTTDGGLTWTAGTVPAPASYNWSMIFGHNADTAWAMYYDAVAGSGGGIYFTGDGGSTWAQQGVGTIFNANSFPDVVYFWDGLQGVAIGDPNAGAFEIYTTIDAGNTWTATPSANIPAPLAGEYGIVAHYSVVGDIIYFDTNKGRVYKSIDKGLNWTASVTGITVPANGAMDICFYNDSTGIARLYDATSTASTMKTTNDGGATWVSATPNGNFFGADVKHIPGTASRLISTGIDGTSGFTGTSFSDDGGLNWVDFDNGTQRGAIGAIDTNHIWVGGFNTSTTSDGIFLFNYIPQVPCIDTNITAGVAVASDSILCPGDTLTVTSTGVFAPNEGSASGVAWLVSRVDISGSSNPQNDTSVVLVYNFNFPAPATSVRTFINDGSQIGTTLPYGTYFWSPVVFGNATVNNIPPASLNDLTLDPSCTHVGNSVLVMVLDANDPLCGVGIVENNVKQLSVTGNFNNDQNLHLIINSDKSEKATIRICDVTGRVVYEKSQNITTGINKQEINAGNFGTGLYLVQIETSNATAVSKIAKQ